MLPSDPIPPSRVAPALAHSLAATVAAHLDLRRVLVLGPAGEEVVDALRARLERAAVVSGREAVFEEWITWPDLIVCAFELSSSPDPARTVERLVTLGSASHVAFLERGDLPLIPLLERTFTTVEWFVQQSGEHAHLVYLGAPRERSLCSTARVTRASARSWSIPA